MKYYLSMVVKTRDRLIEVARKLFLLKGIENTTMLDIANASDNGRRTLYSYFKNKSDIYSAVIERESEAYVKPLREIAAEESSPIDKIERFIHERFEALHIAAGQKESILSWLKIDFNKTEKIKKAVFEKEEAIISDIIDEGIGQGVFDPDRSIALPHMLPTMIRAIWEESHKNGEEEKKKTEMSFTAFVINGLKKHGV